MSKKIVSAITAGVFVLSFVSCGKMPKKNTLTGRTEMRSEIQTSAPYKKETKVEETLPLPTPTPTPSTTPPLFTDGGLGRGTKLRWIGKITVYTTLGLGAAAVIYAAGHFILVPLVPFVFSPAWKGMKRFGKFVYKAGSEKNAPDQ